MVSNKYSKNLRIVFIFLKTLKNNIAINNKKTSKKALIKTILQEKITNKERGISKITR